MGTFRGTDHRGMSVSRQTSPISGITAALTDEATELRGHMRRLASSRRSAGIAGLALLAVAALGGVAGAAEPAADNRTALDAWGGAAAASPAAASIAPVASAAPAAATAGSLLVGPDPLDLILKGTLVAVALFITLRILRRVQGTTSGRGTGTLAILESRTIGPKTQLHLVAVGDRRLVVGQTPQGLVALGELDAAELPLATSDGDAVDADAMAADAEIADVTAPAPSRRIRPLPAMGRSVSFAGITSLYAASRRDDQALRVDEIELLDEAEVETEADGDAREPVGPADVVATPAIVPAMVSSRVSLAEALRRRHPTTTLAVVERTPDEDLAAARARVEAEQAEQAEQAERSREREQAAAAAARLARADEARAVADRAASIAERAIAAAERAAEAAERASSPVPMAHLASSIARQARETRTTSDLRDFRDQPEGRPVRPAISGRALGANDIVDGPIVRAPRDIRPPVRRPATAAAAAAAVRSTAPASTTAAASAESTDDIAARLLARIAELNAVPAAQATPAGEPVVQTAAGPAIRLSAAAAAAATRPVAAPALAAADRPSRQTISERVAAKIAERVAAGQALARADAERAAAAREAAAAAAAADAPAEREQAVVPVRPATRAERAAAVSTGQLGELAEDDEAIAAIVARARRRLEASA